MKKLIIITLLVITFSLPAIEKIDIKTISKLNAAEKIFSRFTPSSVNLISIENNKGFEFSNFIIYADSKTFYKTAYNANIVYEWQLYYIEKLTGKIFVVGNRVDVLCYRDAHFIYFNFNLRDFEFAFNGVKSFTLRFELNEFLRY